MSTHTETVDVVEAARAVRQGWRWILAGVAAGAAIAVAVLLFAPKRFDGAASIVVRESDSGGSSILSRLGNGGAGGVTGMLGLGGGGSLKTEVQVLQSREMLGAVADSLLLQVQVAEPQGMPARGIVSALELRGDFNPATYVLEREGSGYRVQGAEGEARVATPGQAVSLPEGSLTLRRDAALPDRMELELLDREDAVTWMQERISVAMPGGEVIQASFGAPDSVTAAAVPNVLVAKYLAWRLGTDRGVNRHRVEFLTRQADSVRVQLSDAERELRRFQETSGVIEPQVIGRIQLERAGELRAEMGTLDVERGALDQMLGQVRSGAMTPRQLAAYPSFLRSPAINELINQISTLETQRSELLERRLETDRTVVTIDKSIQTLEAQLVPLATAYRASLDRQRGDMAQQLDTISTVLATMPATSESATRLQRDVVRLSQIHTALQAQLVEARLSAVGEGGDIRQLDTAHPAKEPAFPRPVTTLAAGIGGGLVIGLVLALLAGLLGRWIQDPRAIERMAGVPALALDAGSPLLVAGAPTRPTVLLVPIEDGISTAGVAARLARTALARGAAPTVLDLSGTMLPSSTAGAESVSARLARMEREHEMVIVQLPGLTHDTTVAALSDSRTVLLVASAGRVERQRLVGAVNTLRQLDIPCAGVVLNRTSDAIAAG